MSYEQLLEKIKKLSLLITRTADDIIAIETIMEEELNKDPRNITLLIRLALLELMIPLVDTNKSIIFLNRIIELDSNNVMAVLLLSCINEFWYGGIDSNLLKTINNLQTQNLEYKALLEFVKSWHYRDNKNYEMYEKSLILSVEFGKNFVHNHWDLGVFYLNKNKYKGKKLIEQAVKNVKIIYDMENDDFYHDETDVEEYMNEHLKGIHMIQYLYNDLIKLLDQ